jgi:uncharacterized protein (DUF58 family)
MRAPVPRPTTRGLAAAVAFVVAVAVATVTSTPELVPLAVVIGFPLLLAPWLARRRARMALATVVLHAHVEPATEEVGGTMEVLVAVTTRATGPNRPPPLGLASTDRQWHTRGTTVPTPHRQPWCAPSAESLMTLPSPEAGTTARCSLAVPTHRRGVLELPPQACWAYDPLGLFGARGPLTPSVIAVVHPSPIDPGGSITQLSDPMPGTGTLLVSGSGGGLGDLEGIRPYVPGDRLSLLHWPAWARYGTLFVRQFGGESTNALPLLLDDRAGVHRRADFDRLVSATLWAVDEALDGGQTVVLSTLSGRTTTFAPTEQGHADARLLLAELQPARSRSPVASPVVVPAGTRLLTTRTGAERLGPPGAVAGGAGGRKTPLVVV